MQRNLKAHAVYYTPSTGEKARISNGMGAKDSFLARLYLTLCMEAGHSHT
jgi:hypothetical protein